jgi:hypothetical protein
MVIAVATQALPPDIDCLLRCVQFVEARASLKSDRDPDISIVSSNGDSTSIPAPIAQGRHSPIEQLSRGSGD